MKKALITGANRGIGWELVKQLLEAGWKVFATSRGGKGTELLEALGKGHDRLTVLELDLNDGKSLTEFAEALTDLAGLDLLINNAGVFLDKNEGALSVSTDLVVESFEINALGALRVFRAMYPHLKRSSSPVVVNISSQMGSIADNKMGGYYGYRMSKAALNMMTKTLAVDFPDITSVVMHPGWVKTDMGGAEAPLSPQESARGLLKVIGSLSRGNSGQFLNYRGDVLPW